MTSREVSKLLRGKRISRVELHGDVTAPTNGGRASQMPEIVLEGGTRLRFLVHEMPDGGDYAISMVIHMGTAVLFSDEPGGKL
jgi:hypothetical protein